MSFSKVDRETYGPGWGEVILGAVLAILLGIVVAMLYLAMKPVVTVTKLPDPKVSPGQVTYIEGSKDSSKGQAWMRKRQAFLDGQSVELSEDELNTALAKTTGKTAAPAPAKEVLKSKKSKAKEKEKDQPPPAVDEPYLVPGAINFRIADDLLQVSLPVRIPLLDTTVIVQAAGVFAKGDSGTFEFVPEKFLVGSLPVHRIPRASGEIISRLSKSDVLPEDMRSAWAKVAAVRIENRLLKVDLP